MGVVAVVALTSFGLSGCGTPAPGPTTTPVVTATSTSQHTSPTTTPSITVPAGVTTIIDVRTPQEYASGHLKGAVNIDISNADFESQIAALPKDRTYILYCRSGVRAGAALQRMRDAGFTDVKNAGGISDASKATGLPIVTQ